LFALGAAVVQSYRLSTLQHEVAVLRGENYELGRLKAENAELTKLKSDAREIEFLRKDSAELAKLRSEIRKLRDQKPEADKLRAEVKKLQDQVKQAQAQVATAPPTVANVPVAAPEAGVLATKAFQVDPTALSEAVKAEDDNSNLSVEHLKAYFAKAGVDLSPPKSIAFAARQGSVVVRATTQELETIEELLGAVNAPAVQEQEQEQEQQP
jgi:hypothetical protein